MKISIAGKTDTGVVRPSNEDDFIIAALNDGKKVGKLTTDTEGLALFFIVADGMGGAAGGEIASDIAVHAALDHAMAQKNTEASVMLSDAMKFAHTSVLDDAEANANRKGMGAVATACLIADGMMSFAHVGDTRLYVFENGKLQQLTSDQSFVNELVKKGVITQEQAKTHPQRNVVLQALGASEQLIPDTGSKKVLPGLKFLVCSDGLHGMVSDSDIENILKSGDESEKKVTRLIQAANQGGGKDNITAIVVET